MAITWRETQPAGNVNKLWARCIGTDGENFMIAGDASPGRLYISTNKGVSWSETQPDGDANKNWYSGAVGKNGVAIVGQYASGGKVFLTTNYGANWTDITPGSGDFLTVACSGTGQYLLAGAYGAGAGITYFSNNYGASWTNIKVSLANKAVHSAKISTDGKYVLVGTHNNTVFQSDDYGNSFVAVAGVSTYSRSVAMSNNGKNRLAISANLGRVKMSSDYGANYSEIYPTGSAEDKYWRALAIENYGQRVLAGHGEGTNPQNVYYSDNSGANFNEIFPTGSDVNMNWWFSVFDDEASIIMLSGMTRLYVGEQDPITPPTPSGNVIRLLRRKTLPS